MAAEPGQQRPTISTHVLDTHVTDASPPVTAPAPTLTLGGLSVHDAHFLV